MESLSLAPQPRGLLCLGWGELSLHWGSQNSGAFALSPTGWGVLSVTALPASCFLARSEERKRNSKLNVEVFL